MTDTRRSFFKKLLAGGAALLLPEALAVEVPKRRVMVPGWGPGVGSQWLPVPNGRFLLVKDFDGAVLSYYFFPAPEGDFRIRFQTNSGAFLSVAEVLSEEAKP